MQRDEIDPLQAQPIRPSTGDLTIALKAKEHRLSSLLDDRGRIGRDLHDCVLQSLYAIGLNIETSHRVSPPKSTGEKQTNDGVIEQVNRLIHEVRRMIRGLELGTIQDFDLAAELSSLCRTYQQIGPLQITLDLQPAAIDVLTKEEEQEILNIVREALSNCVRHAHATTATVSIRMRGTRIRVTISDNGTGFVVTKDGPQGYGLANMEARARKLGGNLRVQSKVGQGTHVIGEFFLEPLLVPV